MKEEKGEEKGEERGLRENRRTKTRGGGKAGTHVKEIKIC